MEQFVKIKKESVNECFKKGLVKPNEFKSIVDENIHKELFMRYEEMKSKNMTATFLYDLFANSTIEKFYENETGLESKDLSEHILYLCKNKPEVLLIDPLNIKELFVAHTVYQKAMCVRNCGDMLESSHTVGEDLFVDKETLRAVEYLLKYKNSVYELLNNNFGE